jgi:precorrin-6A/cobalt-precorrin-6A reductase
MNIEQTQRILILGGTSEAITLATTLAQSPALEVTTSLAGRTRTPAVLGKVRIGSFGGASGLAEYLQHHQVQALIDATHPFAAQMSWNAAAAAAATGIPHLMLVRPAWEKVRGDHWIEVQNHAAAAALLPQLAHRAFLTIGRQELSAYAALKDLWVLMRMIEPPLEETSMPQGLLLMDRGPFTLENEQSLLLEHRIEAVVSKNSGGTSTYAKIAAARALSLPIVMVQRPQMPQTKQVNSVAETICWLSEHLRLDETLLR